MVTQLRLARTILFQQGEDKSSLMTLIEQVQKGLLKPPPHQREFVWSNEKVEAWATTLMMNAEGEPASLPVGYMATYQLRETGEYFLNDGWQRLNATLRFLEGGYKKHKITEDEARSVVWGYKVVVSHRIYDTQTEAMYWFQVMQLGSPLTPYDFCRGYLTYTPDNTNWMPHLEDLHIFMDSVSPVLQRSGFRAFGVKQNLYKRHDYALFYRWLSHNKSHISPHPSITLINLNLQQVQKGKMVEQLLAKELQRLGIAQVLTELRAFKAFVEQEKRVIYEVLAEVANPRASYLPPASFRFFLSSAIWRRNNQLGPDDVWKDFLRLAFLHCTTPSRIDVDTDDGPKTFVMALENVSKLPQLVTVLGHAPYTRCIAEAKTKR